MLPKINAFKLYYVRKQELVYFRAWTVTYLWHGIFLPNRSPSFEVYAIFLLREIEDIYANAKSREYDV